jgi:hypothetical protein
LPLPGLKHVSPKNDLPLNQSQLAEADMENVALNNSTSADNDNSDETDADNGGAVVNNVDFEGASDSKQPAFFFDEKNLRLPAFNGLQNFVLQNMNLNIDLGKIDMGQWNKNLKQAYKEINALDWKKVEDGIRQNFAKMKAAKLSQKQQQAIFGESVKFLSQENPLITQKFDAKKFLHQLKLESRDQDSLRALEMRLLNNNRNMRIRRLHDDEAQQGYERNNTTHDDKYYYNYSNTISTGDNDSEDKKTCDQKKSTLIPGKKTLHIIISRIQNNTQTGVLNDKKSLQFSFSGDDDEKPNHKSVISVEVTD